MFQRLQYLIEVHRAAAFQVSHRLLDRIGFAGGFFRAGRRFEIEFRLDEEAERRWRAYAFPGNVRELRNIVIRLVTQYAGQKLSVRDLEAEFDLEALPGTAEAAGEADPVEQAMRHLERGRGVRLDEILQSLEQAYIQAAFRLTRGNVSQAAKLLGVNRTTLYSRIGAGGAEGIKAEGDAGTPPNPAAPSSPAGTK